MNHCSRSGLFADCCPEAASVEEKAEDEVRVKVRAKVKAVVKIFAEGVFIIKYLFSHIDTMGISKPDTINGKQIIASQHNYCEISGYYAIYTKPGEKFTRLFRN